MIFGQLGGYGPPPVFPVDQGDFASPLVGAMAPMKAPLAAAVGRSRPSFGARDIVGILADAVLAGTGRPAVYGPAVAHRQSLLDQAKAEEVQYQRRQQDEDARWQRRQEYERAHPNPSEFDRLLAAAGIDPASERGRALAEQRLTNLANPLVGVDVQTEPGGPTVRQYIRPSAPTAAPPARLQTLPPGSRPLPADGGPTRTGSGTFR